MPEQGREPPKGVGHVSGEDVHPFTPSTSDLSNIEDTRLAINDLNSDSIKNERILKQLINSNDPLAIPYAASTGMMVKQVKEVIDILKRSLKSMGGR